MNKKYDQLLEKFKDVAIDQNRFVSDGALDPKKWNKQKLKILFYYKETYNYGVINISDFYKEWIIKKVPAYCKAGVLAHMILSEDKFKINDVSEIRQQADLLTESISKSAFVNINKTSNIGTKSNDSKIRGKSMLDKELLTEQLKQLNPNIIICGGRVSAQSLFHDLSFLSEKKFEFGKSKIVDNRIIVPMYHLSYPSFRNEWILDCANQVKKLITKLD